MKKLHLCIVSVFAATTALAGVESAYLSNEKVSNRDEVVGYGREYALGTARDSANHAAQVAGATGAALTSAGVGFLLAGNLPVGAMLISMGSVEFAQMGASGGVGQQNGSQRDQLVLGSPNSGTSKDGSSSSPYPELDPKLDDYLNKNGIEPGQFKELVFSGQLNDPSAALTALGLNPNDYSTKIMEKAQVDAQKEFAKIANDVMGTAGDAGSLGMLGAGPDSNKPESLTKINPESRDKKEEEKGIKISKSNKNAVEVPGSAFSTQFIPALFGLPAEAFSAQDQMLLFNAYLREQGIVPNHPGMNIFQMAQQSYRTFSKSRTQSKTAKSRVAKAN
ncbi:MAG: hypothetical protein EBQ92_07525 [Proteobacteria bacterium]|nr:hypothetical protein [Pseudomonadota bacterium]